jgi:hypothetical protein
MLITVASKLGALPIAGMIPARDESGPSPSVTGTATGRRDKVQPVGDRPVPFSCGEGSMFTCLKHEIGSTEAIKGDPYSPDALGGPTWTSKLSPNGAGTESGPSLHGCGYAAMNRYRAGTWPRLCTMLAEAGRTARPAYPLDCRSAATSPTGWASRKP